MGCCGGDNTDDEHPHGKPKSHDPDFKGPIKNRGCTDVLCCLIFFAFILGYLIVAIFAWLNGNPLILLYPTDSQGRICGLKYNDLDLSNKTSLYYFDITKCANAVAVASFQCPTTQICVETCPSEYWTAAQASFTLAASAATGGSRADRAEGVDWSQFICTYGFNPKQEFINGMELSDMLLLEKCASYYVPYDAVVGRCIPMVSETAGALTTASNATITTSTGEEVTSQGLLNGVNPIKYYLEARSIANKIFADLTVSWVWLLVLISLGALLAFIWIVIMRWVAGPMVWITLLSLVVLASFAVYYSYTEWTNMKTQPNSNQSLISVGFTTDLSTYLALADTWLAFLIISGIIDGILILTIIFLRHKIKIAVAVIREASKAVGAIMSSLFFPLVTFVLCLIVVGFWVMTALFLASTGDPIYKYMDNRAEPAVSADRNRTGEVCNIEEFNNDTALSTQVGLKCEFIEYGGESTFHQNVFWLQFAQLFGMLWLLNWVLALGQLTLAGAYSSWYWAWKKPRDIPVFPLYQSFGRALRYHTGSLALGSFIIALIQIIRIILEYIDHKLKKNKENKVAKFIMKCLKCCFWCLEKFLKFLNRNAYIMIAVYGKNFCWSAKEAFKLLIRNVLRAAVLDKIVDFVLFVGKLVVTAAMGVLTWALFTNKLEDTIGGLTAPTLNYYWMPIIIIIISTYMIASGFFNTFAMATDTIFLCFLEDLERHDGSPEKPYYMSKSLMNLLSKKNKKGSESE